MRKVQFDSRYLDSARPWHPESQGTKLSSRADSQAFQDSSKRAQSKQDIACKPPVLAKPKCSLNTKCDDLWSETDALLLKIRQATPAAAADDDSALTAAENKAPAKPNKQAVVRVRVCHGAH